jgi:hypothetical protein
MGITQALLQNGYRLVDNPRNISKSKDLKPSSDLTLVEGGHQQTGVSHKSGQCCHQTI